MPTFGESWKPSDLVRIKPGTPLLTDQILSINSPEFQKLQQGSAAIIQKLRANLPIAAPEGQQPQPQPQTVTLLITPRPAERPRFSKFGGAYNSKNYSDYKKKLVELLKLKIAEGEILVGPEHDYARIDIDFFMPVPKSWTKEVNVDSGDIDFFMPVPKSWTKKRKQAAYGKMLRVKPDKDNAEKAILDSLQEAGVLYEDSQIAQGEPRKWYVLHETDAPRVELWLHRVETLTQDYHPRIFHNL